MVCPGEGKRAMVYGKYLNSRGGDISQSTSIDRGGFETPSSVPCPASIIHRSQAYQRAEVNITRGSSHKRMNEPHLHLPSSPRQSVTQFVIVAINQGKKETQQSPDVRIIAEPQGDMCGG